ncbi:IS4 family transposase [Arthrospira platensis]|uniref:IS4 family transposase n=1 Tax=Limnospira platensis TaxID=118562 RepID=UPI001686538E|nr:transposase [Arthrospira platensis]MBD2576057.1 transposase [Arthrospira platensis FACHB-971]
MGSLTLIKTTRKTYSMLDKLTIISVKNSTWITSWISQFCNSADLKKAGLYKRSGASVASLLRLLIALPLVGLSVHQFKGKQLPVPGRDSFYRMLEQPRYNWRVLLYQIAAKLTQYFSTLTDTDARRVLIIDDSSYKRNRSKHVQYLGRQHDHSEHRYYSGFRMLTLAWSDGHSCLPCEFELMTNADRSKRIGPDPNVDRRTVMGQRVKAATAKATDTTVQMVHRALRYISGADCVVFDSWFCLPSVIAPIAEKIPVICRAKNIAAVRFKSGKRIFSLNSLYHHVKKMPTRHNGPESVIGWITLDLLNVGPVRVVFIRNTNASTGWSAIMSTNTKLTPKAIIQYYAQRWDIEVCFKVLKQHMSLHEMQVRNYTTMVAYTSVVFIRYMMICYYHRCCRDERTLPGIFYHCVQQLQAASLISCIMLIQQRLMEQIIAQALQPAYCLISGMADTLKTFIALINPALTGANTLNVKCES